MKWKKRLEASMYVQVDPVRCEDGVTVMLYGYLLGGSLEVMVLDDVPEDFDIERMRDAGIAASVGQDSRRSP